MHVLRTLRSLAASATVAGLLVGGTQLVAAPLAQAKFSVMAATTAVNLRAQPGTSSRVLTVVPAGAQVVQTGATKNGWTPVRVDGRTGWIYASYLRGTVTASSPASTRASGTTAQVSEAVNLRTGPGTDNPVVRVLGRGTQVKLTGVRQGKWVQVDDSGTLRWLHSGWLSTTVVPVSAQVDAKVASRARATTALMIRTTSGADFTSLGDIARGTILDLTGRSENGVAQVIWQGQLRWVNANYIAPVAASATLDVPSVPKATGTRYARVALAIRTSYGADSRTVGEVPAGTSLAITGVVRNGRAQIVHQGAVRWVTARYLSLVKPSATMAATTLVTTRNGSLNTGGSSGLDSLSSTAKGIVYEVRSNYPQITTMYGVRSDPLPDHPSGHAVDVMIPSYRSNEALGWEIAKHMRANASKLGIKYIIFHQHIWSVARDGEGWRLMANRGGDTANHYDHVHVTVN